MRRNSCGWLGCEQGRVRLIEPASIEISDLRTYDEGWYECSVVMLDEQTGEQATGEQATNNGSWVHLTVNGLYAVVEGIRKPTSLWPCYMSIWRGRQGIYSMDRNAGTPCEMMDNGTWQYQH